MIKAVKLEGSSMSPLFRAGDRALLDSAALPAKIAAGDCAMYDFEGRLLLHRVAEVRTDGVVMADDAARISPHFVPWCDVRGKVVSRNPLKSGLAGLAYSRLKRLLARR